MPNRSRGSLPMQGRFNRSADALGRIQRDPRERLVRGRLPGSSPDGELGDPFRHLLALHVQPTQPWKGATPTTSGREDWLSLGAASQGDGSTSPRTSRRRFAPHPVDLVSCTTSEATTFVRRCNPPSQGRPFPPRRVRRSPQIPDTHQPSCAPQPAVLCLPETSPKLSAAPIELGRDSRESMCGFWSSSSTCIDGWISVGIVVDYWGLEPLPYFVVHEREHPLALSTGVV